MKSYGSLLELSRYFRISSRSHHGLVFIMELAQAETAGQPVSIRTVAQHVGISDGYLEELARVLREGGLIRSARGRRGGYTLAKPAATIDVGVVIRLLDGPVVLAHCQDSTAKEPCPSEQRCASRHFFDRLKTAIDRELNAMTLADLCAIDPAPSNPRPPMEDVALVQR